jgi:hypothetical protein
MGDIHLINMALAGYGIAACAALLLAAFIITIAAVRQNSLGGRHSQPLAASITATPKAAMASSSTQIRRPADREPARRDPAERELARR